MTSINIRKASIFDSQILFDWANDPFTRSNSFNSEKIDWEGHSVWFKNKLSSPSDHIYMAYQLGELLGTIRIEIVAEETIIGITVAPEKRGQGFSSIIIKSACQKFWKTHNNDITAYIKTENFMSVKAFEKAGFSYSNTISFKGVPCFIYKIKKNDNQ